LRFPGRGGMAFAMGNEAGMTREERLAAKLRENLRRRKAQARALGGGGAADGGGDGAQENESGSLPKSPPES
jgi:hypothetical protein